MAANGIDVWLKGVHAGQVAQFAAVAALATGNSYLTLARHLTDAPVRALRSLPGLSYVGFSITISWVTLIGLLSLGWDFGLDKKHVLAQFAAQALAAGIGAPLLMQSSGLALQLGPIDVDPGGFVRGLIEQCQTAMDRRQATERLKTFHFGGLEFERDLTPLTDLVSNALQWDAAKDTDDARRLGEEMAEVVDRDDLPDAVKLQLLQFRLLEKAGEPAVRAAADRLRTIRLQERAVEVPAGEKLTAGDPGPPLTPSL